MNKRADFTSIIIMIVLIFGLSIGAIIFSKVFLDITGELKEVDRFSNNTITSITVAEQSAIPLLDFFIFFSFIAIMIGLIVASIYIDVHPAIIIAFIIALIIGVFIASQLANVYGDITDESELSSTASNFKMTNIILGKYFPAILMLVGVIVIVILYGKSRRVGEV